MNPDRDDAAPALVLAEDPAPVLQAARSFLASGCATRTYGPPWLWTWHST